MAVLVTGSAGFVGAHVLKSLADRGAEVVGLDVVKRPSAPTGVTQLVGDVGRLDQVMDAFVEHDVDRAIVLGYVMAPLMDPAFRDMVGAVRTNLLGVTNVLEAARLLKLKRVVFASTAGVYGPQSMYGERPVGEDDPTSPRSIYAQMKLMNERVASWYRSRHGLDVVIVRAAAILGAYNTMWPAKLLNPVVRGETGKIKFGDDMKTNLVWVDDLATLYASVALAESVPHEIYNASGWDTSVAEVAAIAGQRLPGAKFAFGDRGGPEPTYPVSYDNSRARNDFDWSPAPLEEAVGLHLEQAKTMGSLSGS